MSTKGLKFSAETRAKMSAAGKGRKATLEARANISAGQLGRKHSAETLAKMSAQRKGKKQSPESVAKRSASNRGKKRSPEFCARLSGLLKGRPKSQEHKDKLAAIAYFSWTGGRVAEDFARVLCPAGFVREHHVQWGGVGEFFRLDFAHLDGKVAIELDGRSHKATAEHDAMRDGLLRALGWRIIRIRHD